MNAAVLPAPPAVPTTGLVLDLDPARGAWTDTGRTTPAAAGDLVAAVTDSSGNANHASQSTSGNRFVLDYDGRGVPFLRSNGWGGVLSVSSHLVVADAASLRPGTGEFHIFVVAANLCDDVAFVLAKGNTSSTVTGYSVLYDAGSGVSRAVARCRDTATRASQSFDLPSASAEAGPVLIESHMTGSVITGARNGSTTGWAAGGGGPTANTYTTAISNTDALYIGQTGVGTNYWQGRIYRVVMYQGAMSAADTAAVRRSLLARYRPDLVPTPLAAQSSPSAISTVWTNGTGYSGYRIPVLAASADETLAFIEGRATYGSDTGNIDVVLKRSTDSGSTWGSNVVVADDGTNTCGNPCPIWDAGRAKWHLLYNWNNGSDTEAKIIAGTSISTRKCYYTYSTDGGLTWAAAVEITSQIKPSGSTWHGFGPDAGIVTAGGRIILGDYYVDAVNGQYRTGAVYSDDGGTTWSRATFSDGSTGPAGGNEATVAQMANGKIVLISRWQRSSGNGGQFRLVAESYDGGTTFSPPAPHPLLLAQACNGGLVAVGDRLVTSLVPTTTDRKNSNVLISEDGGRSWPRRSRLYLGQTQYTSLAVLPNGKVGVLIEQDTTGTPKIGFQSFDLP